MTFVKFITPTNLGSEKEKFFHGNNYNPVFSYEWNREKVEKLIAQKPKYKALIESIISQNYSEISENAKECFSTEVNAEALIEAQKKLSNQFKKNASVSLDLIISSFQKAFNFLNLNDYSIEVSDALGFNFRPSPANKKIIVSRNLNLDYFSVDGEIKHELTHVIRFENGAFNKISPSANYLPTEEGLATYFQDYYGAEGEKSLFQHAAEYAMTEISLKSSLRSVYDYLISIGFSPELAWQRSIRHKFGFIDTFKSGDIMKPSMYFHHEQKIISLDESERLRLMVGKISAEELSHYSNYTGIIPISRLIEFYNTNF